MGQAVLSEAVIRYADGVTGMTLLTCTTLVACSPPDRKGIGLIFPTLLTEIGCRLASARRQSSAVTQPTLDTSARALGRVFFSLLRVHRPWNRIVRR